MADQFSAYAANAQDADVSALVRRVTAVEGVAKNALTNTAADISSTAVFASGFVVSGGDAIIGPVAPIPTTATSGFLFISTCAGAPTGVPISSVAGRTAIVYDTTNDKLWAFDPVDAAWEGVVLS
jgi:hypothetical protein